MSTENTFDQTSLGGAGLEARVAALERRLQTELERLARRDAVVAADRAKLWKVGNRRWELSSGRVREVTEQVSKLQSSLRAAERNRDQQVSRLQAELTAATKRVGVLERDLRRWVKLNGVSYINKEAVTSEMQFATDSGVAATPRSPRLVVSVTSTPWRMYDVHYALHSLLSQSLKPDKVVLWLGLELFPDGDADVPQSVLSLRDRGLEIEYCHDVRSFTKLVPALERYPEDIIVTADDDIFYPPDWLENLVTRHESVPDPHITAALARKVLLQDGTPEPYARWPIVGGGDAELGLLPMGVGGVLYPPRALDPQVLDEAAFMSLTPSADDLWFWAMAFRNGTPILPGLRTNESAVGQPPQPYNRGIGLTFVNPQRELGISGEATLGGTNVHDKNSAFFSSLVEEWPALAERLQERPPHVSALVVAHRSAAKLRASLNVLLSQELRNIEIIIARVPTEKDSVGIQSVVDEFSRRDPRVRVLPRAGMQSLAEALNAALATARGEYLAFFDSMSTIDTRYLARLYSSACREGSTLARALVGRENEEGVADHRANQLIRDRFDGSQLLAPDESPLLLEGALILRERIPGGGAGRFDVNASWFRAAYSWLAELLQVAGLVVPVTAVKYRQHDAGLIDPAMDSLRGFISRTEGYRTALDAVSQHPHFVRTILDEWFCVIENAAHRAPCGWSSQDVRLAVLDFVRAVSAVGPTTVNQDSPPWQALLEAESLDNYMDQRTSESLLVSVVVPILNDEVEIERWLTSIEQQKINGSCYEIVFVDCGSTDRSATILEQLARESSNVHFERRTMGSTQLSVFEALERGLAAARAPHVLIGNVRRPLDSAALRRLTSVASDNNLDLVIGVPEEKDPHSVEAWDWRLLPAPTSVARLNENVGLLHSIQLGVGTSLIRTEMLRATLEDDGEETGGCHQEREVMALLLGRAQGISYRKEIPVARRIESEPALTSSATATRLREFLSLRQRYIEFDGISFWIERVDEFVRRFFVWVANAPLPEEDEPDGELIDLLEEFFDVCDDLNLAHELEAIRSALPRAFRLRGANLLGKGADLLAVGSTGSVA